MSTLKSTYTTLFLLLLFSFCASKDADLEINATVEPLYSIEFLEAGKFADKEEIEGFSIQRAKVGLTFEKIYKNHAYLAEVSVDFTEEELSEILKDSWLCLRVRPQLLFKVGKFKSHFGLESSMSSSKLPLIFRGELSKFIRKKATIGGRQLGLEISGEVNRYFQYSLATFNYSGFTTPGGTFIAQVNRSTALPILTFSSNPHDIVKLQYSLAIPFIGAVTEDNTITGDRYFFHSLGATVLTKRYEGIAELLFAPDTSKYVKLIPYLDYDEAISQALALTNSYIHPLKKDNTLSVHSRFEYLNGLNYDWLTLSDREFYYTLTEGIKFTNKKKFAISINVTSKYDKDFKSIKATKLSIQASSRFSILRNNS